MEKVRTFSVKDGKMVFTTSLSRGQIKVLDLIEEFTERRDVSDFDIKDVHTHSLDIMVDLINLGKGNVRVEEFASIVKNDEKWAGSWHSNNYYNTLTAYCGKDVIAVLNLIRDDVDMNNIILNWVVTSISVIDITNGSYELLDELFARMNQFDVLGPILIPRQKPAVNPEVKGQTAPSLTT